MARARRLAPRVATPFDPEPGTELQVPMGRVLPRTFNVRYVRQIASGCYYDVYDPHHKVDALVKQTQFGTFSCLRCRKPDDCLHAHAARKAHKQLWWTMANAGDNERSTHECVAEGCTVRLPHSMLMCKRHWRLVPQDIQQRVWRAYERAQGGNGRAVPSKGWIDAVDAAVAAVRGR